MEFKDLKDGNQTIGKYIEVDISQYTLELVSRKMFGNQKKTVREFINSTNNAVAGINGGLFQLLGSNLVGYSKDSAGNSDGDSNVYGPHISWSDNKLNQFWGKGSEATGSWVLSPAYYWFLRDGGYVIGDVMTNYGGQLDVSDTRSMIGQKTDGTIILAATTSPIKAEKQAEVLSKLGCVVGANLDGGGSRQLVIKSESTSPIEFSRDVPNAILVVKRNDTPVVPEQGKCTMKLYGSAARLRKDVVNGTEVVLIPNGSEFEVIGLYSWKASDGYRWGYGKWNGYEGYFQYDPYVMMPLGNHLDTLNYKMRLFNSDARIRTSPVNGSIQFTVPNGNDVTIIQFGKIKESDGYQWFQGTYNGITGFLQYDPAVMFPTND